MRHRILFSIAFSALAISGCDSFDPRVRDALAYIRSQQNDPDATKFQNIVKCRNGITVKGEVLGKNSYGAYTGWHAFYASKYSASIAGEDYFDADEEEKQCNMTREDWSAYIDKKYRSSESAASLEAEDTLDSDLN